MADEFYSATAGIYGGNWWCSPRGPMFHGVVPFSQCSLDVPNVHRPWAESLKSGRICDEHYSRSNDLGLSGCGTGFMAAGTGNGFPPSAFKELGGTLFDDSGNLVDINGYSSIVDEFSGEDSTTLLQNYLFGDDSDFHIGRGLIACGFNIQNNLAASPDDHSSNLSRPSPPYVPNSRPNPKPYTTTNLQPSNEPSPTRQPVTNMWDSAVDSPARQSQNKPLDPLLTLKTESSVLGASNTTRSGLKSSTKRSTTMVESSVPKRPRIQTPSPLPTFKVRKEKLGDRITALQQLVSPFGKTDTASVLHEAIEYIKFLHDQAHQSLSKPWVKDAVLHQFPPQRTELRNRGLCLVPISSAFPVSGEAPVDFWTPNLGGTFR